MADDEKDGVDESLMTDEVSNPGTKRVNKKGAAIAFGIIGVILTFVIYQMFSMGRIEAQGYQREEHVVDSLENARGMTRTITIPSMPTLPTTDIAVIPEAKPDVVTPPTQQQTPTPTQQQDRRPIMPPQQSQTRQPRLMATAKPDAPDPFLVEMMRLEGVRQKQFEAAITGGVGVRFDDNNSSRNENPYTPFVAGGAAAPMNRRDMLAAVQSERERMQKLVDQYGSDASEVYQRQMAEMQGRNPSVGAFDAGATQMPETPYATSVQPVAMGQGGGGGRGNSLAAFDGDESRWFLDSRMDIPGKFVLRAGGVIPAILLSGINSDLPGQILAQVSQDVYDTATGRYLLIPQGTRLIGAYSSEVIYGQNRVFAAWQRLIFPDGRAYDIGSQPATTGAGYAGLRDRVNMHFMRVFGSALLMSAIVGGISYSQDDTSTSGSYGDGEASRNNALSSTMSEALGQQLGQVTVEMIRRNMNIAPTLEVRPGFRMNVMLVKDVQFRREYKAFDYSYANR